jgi:hypothetical protein
LLANQYDRTQASEACIPVKTIDNLRDLIMSIYKTLLTLGFVLLSHPSLAEIYKCKTADGKTVFQDRRCAGEAVGQTVANKPTRQLCFNFTNIKGESFNVQNFWNETEKSNRIFYLLKGKAKTAVAVEQIQAMKASQPSDDCVAVNVVTVNRESFDASLCGKMEYLTDDNKEGVLTATNLDVLKPCQSSSHADGVWKLSGKPYPIQAAYVGYSKQTNEIRIIAFPFVLSKAEEESISKPGGVDTVINSHSDKIIFGMVLKLNAGVTAPQSGDVVQAQSILIENGLKKVRTYDQNWRRAVNIKKWVMAKNQAGQTIDISWSLTNLEEQADVNVSAAVVNEN